MTRSLLEQFVALECRSYERQLLQEAIADVSVHKRLFAFNLFEITIDRDANVAELADVLSPPESPTERVPLAEFAKAIAARTSDL